MAYGNPACTPARLHDWAKCFLPIFSPKQRRPVVPPRPRPTLPPTSTSQDQPFGPCSVRREPFYRACPKRHQRRCGAVRFGRPRKFSRDASMGNREGCSARFGAPCSRPTADTLGRMGRQRSCSCSPCRGQAACVRQITLYEARYAWAWVRAAFTWLEPVGQTGRVPIVLFQFSTP